MLQYHSPHQAAMRSKLGCADIRKGFTLVELLVVIGIIALLISLLLPSLIHARQQAQRTSCAAKLHAIMIAASIHAADHRGYYPLAGVLSGGQPEDLQDPDVVKYTYLGVAVTSGSNTSGSSSSASSAPRQIAPITMALASEMSFARDLNQTNSQQVLTMMDPSDLTRCFTCPSQNTDLSKFVPAHSALYYVYYPGPNASYTMDYNAPQSYIFNEAVLGSSIYYPTRLKGHASAVRQPGLTMFAADGLGDSSNVGRGEENGATIGTYTVFNVANNAPVTLADSFNGRTAVAGPTGVLTNGFNVSTVVDMKRHQGQINIAFCDGHVETRNLSPSTQFQDMRKVYLIAP